MRVRLRLRQLRKGGSESVSELLAKDLADKALPGQILDALAAAAEDSRAESVSCHSESAGTEATSIVARTVAERFLHVTEEVPCPNGCLSAVRCGHRVGALSKYASMERLQQATSVLCYCPQCFEESGALL